jgi:glycosyltransferase involved in cell wall biosynthesis
MPSKVRIGSVWSNLYGTGGGNRMLTFARGFDRSRYELVMIVVGRGDLDHIEKYGSTRSRFVDAGVEVVGLDAPVWSAAVSELRPGAVLDGAGRFARLAARLTHLVRERKLDVLDLNGGISLGLGICVSKLLRLPTVATIFDNFFWDRPLWRPFGRRLMSQPDVILTDSEQRSQLLQRWLSLARAPRVIRNGISIPVSPHGKAEMRKRLGLPNGEDVKVIGQVSSIMPSKGQMVLLDAIRQVLPRFPSVCLLICGYPAPRNETDFVAELHARARAYGIDERVRILSYPGDIADVWTAIDIHVHPSMRDSSPIAVIEGMSLGKPAVVTAEGGIVELVAHEQSGLVVPPGNADALARAIEQLLRQPAIAAEFGRAAQRRYQARHQPEPMVRELERVFSATAQSS